MRDSSYQSRCITTTNDFTVGCENINISKGDDILMLAGLR